MSETARLITLRDKLVLLMGEAAQEVEDDNDEWEERGLAGEAQDSEQAEASGILIGRYEGLKEAVDLVVEEIVVADRGGLSELDDEAFMEVRGRVAEETIRRNAEWAIPMGGQVGLDTTSSASRQHRIDTGEYLREGEAYEA